jgi:cell fate regulator YaaT (PSP1 superfamily)
VSVSSFEQVAIRMQLAANMPCVCNMLFTYCSKEQFMLDLEIHRFRGLQTTFLVIL